jgi:N-acetyl-alpha-D-muramate 1-phosphate uridylyltransferase
MNLTCRKFWSSQNNEHQNMSIGERAIILAAGLGTRMRPITDTMPKPLVSVMGKPLIGYAMDALRAADVKRAVVNVHYFPEQLESWCAAQGTGPDIVVSDERDTVLETGGGIVRALPHLGEDPFFVLNSDSFWLEKTTPALQRLKQAWREDDMDCLLLLVPPARTVGYDGSGDFERSLGGALIRKTQNPRAPLAYIGGYLVHPRLFENAPPGKFSMNILWDRAIANNRLHGLVHDGWWLHVGTPDAIGLAEAHMRASE